MNRNTILCNSANNGAVAVLDRCGNNWRNGKGGCGPLLHNEYAPTIPTMFQPFVIQPINRQTDLRANEKSRQHKNQDMP